MWQEALNTIGTAALTALVGVAVVAIKVLGDAAGKYITEKAAAVRAKAGADKWNHWMDLARQTFAAVDEEFRITPTLESTISAKQKLFDEALKKAIPEITDAQIEQLRQAVAGEINKGRAAICGQVTDEQGNIGGLAAETTVPATQTA
ncbi:MAG: hypothetical protein LKF71_04295 [Oscillospiraceae bacterium]|jgi:hypothetical protein|nr:hypothetical protein [Oscillospiraceae bacterium]